MQWFRNLSTAVKLMAGFAIVGLLVAVVGGMALLNMSTINTNVEKVYETEMIPSLLLANMRSLTNEGRSDVYHALAVKDPEEVKGKVDKARGIQKQIEQLWAEYEPTMHTEKGKAAFKKYKEVAQLYDQGREEKIFKPLLAGQLDAAWAGAAEIRPKYHAAVDALGAAIELKKDQAKERYTDSGATYASSRTVTIGLAVGGMLLGLGIGWGISRMIAKPLNQAVGVLQAVAAGDLTKRLEVDTKDEVGQMATALNTAIEKLRAAEEAKARRAKEDAERAEQDRQQAERQRQQEREEAQRKQEQADKERREAEELRAKVDTVLEVVTAAADGDLTREVSVTGEDPIGQVGRALVQLLSNLRSSVGAIAGNAQALAGASEELSAVSTQMSANAEETAAQAGVVSAASEQVSKNVQTVATGTEEMSASIREIAKNASEAARVAQSAVQVAQSANVTVGKLGE